MSLKSQNNKAQFPTQLFLDPKKTSVILKISFTIFWFNLKWIYTMKKNIILLVVSFVFAIFSFVGCDIVDDNPIEPGGNQDGRRSGQPLPTFSYIQNMNGIMATIQFGYSIPVIGSIDYVMGFARFGTNG
ncbi:MAG: hypothetical protein C0425_03845, partial [Chlorobiaceae bacterium]|nr:hypothetical protein [Chlorobiaceae bacterium]MBA4309448.1 hypothetical protein [Chlorobiaceae bacterium]